MGHKFDHITMNTMIANFICIIILSALDLFSESCNIVSYGSVATIFLLYHLHKRNFVSLKTEMK